MKLKTKIGVWKARRNAERELGFKISNDEAKEVLSYCIRKLPYIKKDESYLPLLYECTIPQHLQMRAINQVSFEMMRLRKEVGTNVFGVQTAPLPSDVS